MGITPRKVKGNVHGIDVDQLDFSGNIYTTVVSRIKIALQADPALIQSEKGGYHVVSSEIIPIGDRFAYRVIIEYPLHSGIYVHGSDFIDMKDNAGLAKAESSAYGRALGLRGIASDDGIASADEVERATIDNSGTKEKKTVVNTNTGDDTAKVKEELKSLMGLFGLTVDEIKAYLDKYKMPFDAKASADIVNALQHPQNSFKVVSRIKGIPQELFDAWATKEGNSWVSMYATATKDCQAFYTAISPKSSANIATGSI